LTLSVRQVRQQRDLTDIASTTDGDPNALIAESAVNVAVSGVAKKTNWDSVRQTFDSKSSGNRLPAQ
jgi:hypothetical protein